MQRFWPTTILILFISAGCEVLNYDETPTGTTPVSTTTTTSSPGSVTVTVTAPSAVSPSPGGELTETQPTLTVSNATASDGSALTYVFQIATDNAFGSVVVQAVGVAQDASGRTSWKVTSPLEPRQYFWRAKARTATVEGPFSSVSDFRVSAPRTDPGPAGALVVDPLTNGRSVGEVNGGRFVGRGWQVTAKSDFLRYEIKPVPSGYVEWETSGLAASNPALDNYMLLGMWDPSAGPYRENPYRVHVQKLDTNHNKPYIRLRWIAGNEEHNVGNNFLGWESSRTYRFRLEWGPESGGNFVRVALDGSTIIQERYTRSYAPQMQYIELGIAERQESIVNTVYANVRIGVK